MYYQHYTPYVIAFNPRNKGTDLVFFFLFVQRGKLSFSCNHGYDHSLASNISVNVHQSITVCLTCGCTLEHLGNLKS